MTKEATNYRKTHVSMKGKSDKQQKHFVKYEVSHQDGKLERWYKKITTPKPEKPARVRNIITPTFTEEQKRKMAVLDYKRKNKLSVHNAKAMARLCKYKRDTHWVARSEAEYLDMHSH